MTSILDSEAHFRKRSEEVGLSDRGRQAVVVAGYSTLGRLAFGVGQPGTPVPDQEFQRFATNILGGLASMHDVSAIKRLLFEAQTMTMAQLRDQVSNPDAPTMRKIPPVEREAKMRQLRARLPGVVIEKQLEPSHALLNLMGQIWESRQLQYIPIEKLTSREHEVLHAKPSKQLSIDSERLLVKEETKTPDQAATTEMQTLEALKRRGIAMAFCDMLTWEQHERYLQSLFGHLRSEPPEGYVRPSLQQILRADREVFLTMIRRDVNVRRGADDVLQMDDEIINALRSYDVGFHLMPLPKPKASDSSQPKSTSYGPSPAPAQGAPRATPYGKGAQNCKQKGKGKKQVNILPKELQNRGCLGQDEHGRRLCFNFNLGKCSEAASGAQCPRGWHLCMKKGCHAPHSVLEHEKSKGTTA